MSQILFEKYNIPVPRYTSYPTVPHWKEIPSFEDWCDSLKTQSVDGVDLYIHVPFCETLCYYCGCNRKITKNKANSDEYVSYLKKEWDLYNNSLGKMKINALHFGGGTPNFLETSAMRNLLDYIGMDEKTYSSIEVDPRTLDQDFLNLLYEKKFNHISFGIQDFDLSVQEAINRVQPFNLVASIVEEVRKNSKMLINFDLIYGLPRQNKKSIEDTIQKVKILRPDHIALYSYAHLPEQIKNQKLIKSEELPHGDEKRSLYDLSKKLLEESAYIEIGLDHFALVDSPLAIAFKERRLKRSFMGYTTKKSDTLIGLGATSISENKDYYVQNTKDIKEYYSNLDRLSSSFVKGHHLSDLDFTQKKLINDLMCNLYVDLNSLGDEYYEEVSQKLLDLESDGLIELNNKELKVTEVGKMFLRNIASTFDSYLSHNMGKTKFSSSI